jgi:hypothetical protein
MSSGPRSSQEAAFSGRTMHRFVIEVDQKNYDSVQLVRNANCRGMVSTSLWELFDDAQRRELETEVCAILLRLVDQVEGWLPTSLGSKGDWLDVVINMKIPDSEEIVNRSRERRERKRGLVLTELLDIEARTR